MRNFEDCFLMVLFFLCLNSDPVPLLLVCPLLDYKKVQIFELTINQKAIYKNV